MREKLLNLFLLVCMLTGGTQIVSATDYLETANYTQDFSTLSYTEVEDEDGWSTTKVYTYPEDWSLYKYGEPELYSDYCYSSGQSFGFESKYNSTSPYALVTPAFKGNVSFYIRQPKDLSEYQETNSTMVVHKMNSDGTLGETINIDDQISGVSGSEWTQVTVNLSDYTRLALAPCYMMVSNLSADYAGIEVKKYLDITATKLSEPTSTYSIVCDENKQFHVVGTVTVVNNGNVTFTEGDENYTVYVKNSKTNDVYQTINVPTLAPGETATLNFDFYITFPDDAELNYSNEWTFSLNAMTDFGSSSSSYAKKIFGSSWFYVKPPKGIMAFYGEDGYHYEGKVVDFGLFQGTSTRAFTLKNVGGGDLVITAASYPEGVSIPELAELPYTLAAQASVPVTLTMTSAKTGAISGTIEFTYDGILDKLDNNNLTGNQILVQGSSVKDGDYLVTFEDAKIPSGWYLPTGSKWTLTSKSTYSPFSSTNMYAIENGSQSPLTSVITPKLEFKAGETFNFQVSKKTSYGGELEIYYSTDRTNWTELAHYGYDSDHGDIIFPSDYNSFNSYSVTIPEAGEYYFKFDAGYVYLDNLFGGRLVDVAHDVVASSLAVSGKYEVNSAYNVSAIFQNVSANAEAADEYTVTFYANGEKVGEGDCSADFDGGASKTFTCDVTPHATGDYTLKAVFATADGECTATTEEKSVTIYAETAMNEGVVGELKYFTTTSVPLKLGDKNSRSEIIYTKERMESAGISAGNIVKIAYPYYISYKSSFADFPLNVKIWMENTDDTSVDSFSNTDELTLVYSNDNYAFDRTLGSSSNYQMMEFVLDNSFNYTGGAVRIVIESRATGYQSTQFAYCSIEDGDVMRVKSSDSESYYESAAGSLYTYYFPVTYIYTEGTPASVTGKVTDFTAGDAGVAGATVTFTSGDVEYSTTSLSDGTYSLDIVKSDLTYTAKVKKDGYKTNKVESVDLANAVDLVTRPLLTGSYDGWPVTITKVPNHDYGYTTFYGLPYSDITVPDGSFYTLVLPEGIEAYVYGVDEGSYTLVPTKIEGNIIPAGVGVVLYTEDPQYYGDEIMLDEAADEPEAEEIEAWNAKSNLYGSMGDAKTTAPDGTTDGYYFYKLQYDYDSDCVGFYWGAEDGAAFPSKQEKAWLYIEKDVAAKMSNFSIEEGKTTTGISTLKAETESAKGIYTVSGQKMDKASKPGLYIIDGKKVVVK